MREYRLMGAAWFCLGLLVLPGCAAQPTGTASQAPVPALQPSMARVWVLRQGNAPGGNVAAADPMVYANAAPVAQSPQGTVFSTSRAASNSTTGIRQFPKLQG
jgi:hypothetical protein